MKYSILNIISAKNLLVVAGCLLALTSTNAQRIKQSINTAWQFHKGDDTDSTTSGYWQDVNLPHTWNIEDVMDDTPGYYRGVGWYQKDIFIPAGWKDKSIYIYFEGSSQVTEVFVNGKSAGKHIGGYSGFSFNISQLLQTGSNKLRIMVDNAYNDSIAPLMGDFSVFGGIYRDVYLIAANVNHFDLDNYASTGVFVTTPQVSAEKASIQVKGKVTKASADKLSIKTTVYDATGTVVAKVESKPEKDGSFTAQIKTISNPKLWSPENPYLYKIVTSLVDKLGKITDEVANPLGFRWYSFDGNKGFFLNGKPYKIIGASRHQDYKGIGNALPDALHISDLQLLKDMGGNFLRVAHYPQDPAVMEACDRLGLLASVETPGACEITESESYSYNMLEMQKEMIRQNYNHPSVIMWSYLNEVLLFPHYDENSEKREQYFANVRNLAQKIEDLTRAEDPARYTIVACHGEFERYAKAGLLEIPKIVGWNLYQGWYVGEFADFEKFLLKHHEAYPNKPLMITEYGADADYRLHDFNPTRFDKTQEYTNKFHEAYLKTIMKYPFIAGGVVWNLVEFNSEFRQEAVPHINNKGLVTADRKPKDSYWFYKVHLVNDSFIKIGGGDWYNRSQQADNGNLIATQPVTVYSNQPEITLFLNDKQIGKQKTEDKKSVFNVPFVNGKNQLKAITNNGQEDVVSIDFHVIANDLKTNENPFTTLNVSLGDRRMFLDDFTGEAWVPEQEYTTGSWGYIGGKLYKEDEKGYRYGSPRNILGTPYDAIYETQRTNIKAFKADVPNGVYEVTLHFAELVAKEKDKLIYNLDASKDTPKKDFINRNFDVIINGTTVIENLSIENYLKPIHAYSTKTTMNVVNGEGIVVDFKANQGEAILNGVQIRKIF